MKTKTITMNAEQKAIWRAAYGAWFATEFLNQERVLGSFNSAAANMNAEDGITIADLAVARLEQWREEENSAAGVVADDLREDYWKE